MTAVLGRVPVERVGVRARRARPGRVLLAVVVGLLYGLGWLSRRTLAAAWLAASYGAAALAEGWASAGPPRKPPLRP